MRRTPRWRTPAPRYGLGVSSSIAPRLDSFRGRDSKKPRHHPAGAPGLRERRGPFPSPGRGARKDPGAGGSNHRLNHLTASLVGRPGRCLLLGRFTRQAPQLTAQTLQSRAEEERPTAPTAPRRPTHPTHPTQPTQLTHPTQATHARQRALPSPARIAALATTPALSRTPALPRTPVLPTVPALPITPTLATVPAEPITPAPATVPALPITPALLSVSAPPGMDGASAVLSMICRDSSSAATVLCSSTDARAFGPICPISAQSHSSSPQPCRGEYIGVIAYGSWSADRVGGREILRAVCSIGGTIRQAF